ncbi:MAG: hypothetical protein DMG32_13000 [Acidobacteria bacterium]|nr:MAG: hypothetical protein DMG32_13000 [Acidobacteriota bacterium]
MAACVEVVLAIPDRIGKAGSLGFAGSETETLISGFDGQFHWFRFFATNRLNKVFNCRYLLRIFSLLGFLRGFLGCQLNPTQSARGLRLHFSTPRLRVVSIRIPQPSLCFLSTK